MKHSPSNESLRTDIQQIAKERWELLEAAWRKELNAERVAEGMEPIYEEKLSPPKIRMESRIGGAAAVDSKFPWEGIGGEIVLNTEFVEQAGNDALSRQIDHAMILILTNGALAEDLATFGLNKQPEDVERVIQRGNLKPGDPDQPNWLVGPETLFGKLVKGLTPKEVNRITESRAKKLLELSGASYEDVDRTAREIQDFSDNNPALLPHQRLMRKLARAAYPFRPGSRLDKWFKKLDASISKPFLWIIAPLNRMVFGPLRSPKQSEPFPDRKPGFPRDHGVQPLRDWQRTQTVRRNAESILQISDRPAASPDFSSQDMMAEHKPRPIEPSPPSPLERTSKGSASAPDDLAESGLSVGRNLTD
jgi:hypothetical protein